MIDGPQLIGAVVLAEVWVTADDLHVIDQPRRG
jgi:hypothetical protein